jgi:hypothetical protein
MQVPFIQQQNFENGNHSSFGYQPTTPLFRPVVLADNLLQSMKSGNPIEIYFMGEIEIFINLIP